jgi:hypothetical protein
VAIDPEGRVVRGDAAGLLEEHLLTTSAEVRALRTALEQDLARGLERAAAARQDHAGHALLRHADGLDDPARQRDLARTLRGVGGPFAARYFTGQHGLASPDAGVRRFAVEALAEVAEPRDYATLRTLELAAAAEPDPELERALRELIARLAEG